MPPDGTTECWLCNINHEDDTVVEIFVNMPTPAALCIDCVACVLRWGEVPSEATVTALNKVENHSIAVLRTKAVSVR